MFSKKKVKKSDKTANTVVVGGSIHRFRPTKKTSVILLFVICLLSLGGYFKFINKPSTLPTDVRELLQSDDSESSQANIVQKYGVESDKATKEAQNSDSVQWDKSQLDKAYVSLLYADKVGAFANVYTMLAKIEAAQRSGQNVDDNSYGITQSMRDAIRERADANAKKVIDSHAGAEGE